MTKLQKEVTTGTDSKEDLLLTLKPAPQGSGISVSISGKGAVQFSEEIEATVRQVLEEMGVTDASVEIVDYWAFDFTIRARTKAAVLHATGRDEVVT
ncbi:MAG: citrate lyase acyl carrier protein [Thermoplasmatota archaeon]